MEFIFLKSTKMYIPPEVWELIFDQVQIQNKFTSGYDLLHASQACRQFQEILTSTKTTWLFKEIFPFLLSPLEYRKRHVLPLRQVCKAWREAVDHVLENHEYYLSKLKICNYHDTKFYQNGVVPFSHPLRDIRALVHLCNVETLERILQTKNFCFPGGGVLFYTKHGTDDDYKIRYYNLLTEVLLIHGDKISYLEIEDSAYPAVDFKQFLYQHLLILPNLKTICLILYSVSDIQFKVSTNTVALPKLPRLEGIEFINLFQAQNEMPTLNLKFIGDLCRSFLQNNLRIKHFQLDGFHFCLPVRPPNIKPGTNIFSNDIRMNLYSDQEFARLLSLLDVTSQLNSLIVYCVGGESLWKSVTGTLMLDNLLSSLLDRHCNIKTLRIFCKIPNAILKFSLADLSPESTIILNKLKRLKCLHCFHLYGFTFMQQAILPFLPPSLSCLTVDCVTMEQITSNAINSFCFPADLIRAHKDGRYMHSRLLYTRISICPKKVWAKFPQLQQIRLRTIGERVSGQDDTLGHVKVFRRPVNVDRLIERLDKEDQRKNCRRRCLDITCLSACLFAVIGFSILVYGLFYEADD